MRMKQTNMTKVFDVALYMAVTEYVILKKILILKN